MKILFLTFDRLTQPLGIASLSAVLERAGHRAEVAAVDDVARQEALFADFEPEFLGLSLVTGSHPLFLERACRLKAARPNLIVVAGGPHPTFFPEVIDDPCLDAVCRGEGDMALPALVDAVARDGALPGSMPNWWIKHHDGSVSKGEVAPPVADLDALPFPDRAIFDRARRGDPPPAAYAMTSRGCPFDCTYCFNHAYRELYRGCENLCRRRSVASVVEEVSRLKERYPLQMVVFQDDTFNLDRRWLSEFAERFPREVGLPFHCHLRADLLDEKSAGELRRAGCLSVKLGLEAGREAVRNGILKRGMTLDQFETACALLHRNKIRFATENILGIPGTTLDDDLATYEVNRRVRPDLAYATLMQVYPRTGIAAYASEQGFTTEPVTEFPWTFYDDSTVDIPDKVKRGRFRALFALAVGLRLPIAVVRALVALPLRTAFESIDRIYKGYRLRFRIYPYRQSAAGFARDLLAYLSARYY